MLPATSSPLPLVARLLTLGGEFSQNTTDPDRWMSLDRSQGCGVELIVSVDVDGVVFVDATIVADGVRAEPVTMAASCEWDLVDLLTGRRVGCSTLLDPRVVAAYRAGVEDTGGEPYTDSDLGVLREAVAMARHTLDGDQGRVVALHPRRSRVGGEAA